MRTLSIPFLLLASSIMPTNLVVAFGVLPFHGRTSPTTIATNWSSSRHGWTATCTNLFMNNGRQTKKIVNEMMEFMNEPVKADQTVDQSFVNPGPPEDDDLAPLVRTIAQAADMRKAENIIAMRISKVSAVCSFVMICTGNSRPQNQAIAAAIQNDVKDVFGGDVSLKGNGVPEGTADSGWILLDFGDVMVHVMTPKSRLFYDIEGQWREKGAEYMNLEDVLLPNSSTSSSTASDQSNTRTVISPSEEDDPFWS